MASQSMSVAPGVGPVLVAIIATVGIGSGAAQGQSQLRSRPLGFEAASVKLSGPPVPGVPMGPKGGPGKGTGRFSYNNARLIDLLAHAYNVQLDQVFGPEWIKSTEHTYTIEVTMAPTTTEAEFQAMAQNLLAERFQVRLHHETRNRPGYELNTAKGGLKMKEWTPPKEADASPDSTRTGTLEMRIPPPGRPATAHLRVSMAQLCALLPGMILDTTGARGAEDRPRVVDRTGLKGIYEFKIRYSTADPSRAPSPLPEPGADTAGTPQGAADLFTVLQDQLGLKLRSTKAVSVDVLIVDAASKVPTPN